MKMGRASTYTGEMRAENRGHVAYDTQHLNPQMATGNGKDFTLINMQGFYSDFEIHLKLFMLRAVRYLTTHIPTIAVRLPAIMHKHVVVLLHISAFFGHPREVFNKVKCRNG
jgi:hypothetical protein